MTAPCNHPEMTNIVALFIYFTSIFQAFNSQDFINNSPYHLSYNLCDVSLENLALD